MNCNDPDQGRGCGRQAPRALGLCWLLAPACALATNGFNQIGFGAESVGMGGADIAVASDTTAMNINPAGLVGVAQRQADLLFAVADLRGVRHADAFGNDTSVAQRYAGLGDFGVAARVGSGPLVAGVALFAQGGFGVTFDDLATAFGTRDEMESLLRVARITPSLAWQIDTRWSVGASLVGTYADLHQSLFPGTSFAPATDPSRSFFGFQLRDMDAYGVGGKLGVRYAASDDLSLGAAYTSAVDLDFSGRMRTNLTAVGLGQVTYRDTQVSGIAQPRELGVGAAWQATRRWLLAAEVNWVDWSDALRDLELRAARPDNALASPAITQRLRLGWRDQTVLAVGVAYDVSDAVRVLAGYNYGRNPVPDTHLNPLLAPITEHHVTLGALWRVGSGLRLGAAAEWDIQHRTRYTNPALPFGPDAEGEVAVFAVHLTANFVWH